MKSFLIFLCFVAISLKANAQNWMPTAGPVEDDVFDLCIDSNRVLYAVTPLGVNRSTDGGAQWLRTFLFPTTATAGQITVAPNGEILVSTDVDFFVSNDGDSTFRKRSPNGGRIRQFAASKSGRLFAAYSARLIFCEKDDSIWHIPALLGFPIDHPIAVAASNDTVIALNQGFTYYSFDNGTLWGGQFGVDASQVRKLMILQSGLWLCLLKDFGLMYFDLIAAQWRMFTAHPESAAYYTADIMHDGAMLVSSSKGIHLVHDTSVWLDITSGLGRNDSNDYFPVTRFTEDPQSGICYAATLGAGVWKRERTLQGRRIEATAQQFHVAPNPFAHQTSVYYSAAKQSWYEIELRNILGVAVWKKAREYSAADLNTLPIEVSGIPPGNYLLVLRTSERTETQWVAIVE